MKRILILLFALAAFAAIETKAQVYSLKSVYGFTSDTLTLAAATGTVYLSTAVVSPAPAVTTTIRFTVTEYSGTTAGTATLMGSFDGSTYKAMTTPNTVTALATHTVADAASAVYDWVITGSPYPYYRVSWTATTATFSSKIEAQLFRSK
jgi:hypothetical protein